MARTLSQFKDSVGAMLSGLDMNDVTDLNAAFERGLRNLVSRAKVSEAMGRQSITLYDRVYDYASPPGLFGSSLIDLRPQGNSRSPWDTNNKTFISNFDMTKAFLTNGYMLTTEYSNGVQVLRIANAKTTSAVILDDMSVTTGWTTSGDASNLTEDDTVFYEAPSSLRFNLAALGAQGVLTKTITKQDLTSYRGIGVVFLAIKLPSTNLTSIRLRLGSSSTNYYEVTSTSGFVFPFQGSVWSLVPFNLALASTTGNPVITAMTYSQIAFNYNGTAMPNVYVGNLFIALPSPHEVIYQTAYLLQNSLGVISGTITDNNDILLLNDSTYNIALHECANEIEVQQSGGRATTLNQLFEKKLFDPTNGLYTLYRADNPSQELRTVGNYMD